MAQGQRPLTERRGADLAVKWNGYDKISEVSGPGSGGACRQVREVRAEKPHPIGRRWKHRRQAPLREPKCPANVHAGERSVGKLAANITRRVKTGAKCQSSGKESVANSHTPPFPAAGREARSGDPFYRYAFRTRDPRTESCRRVFSCTFDSMW